MQTLKVFYLDDDLFELKRVATMLQASQDFCQFDVYAESDADAFVDTARGTADVDIFLLDMHLGDGSTNNKMPLMS